MFCLNKLVYFNFKVTERLVIIYSLGEGGKEDIGCVTVQFKKMSLFPKFFELGKLKAGSMESVPLAVIAMTRHPCQFLDSNCRILGVLVEI